MDQHTFNDAQADMIRRLVPSDRQLDTATAIMSADPGIDSVIVVVGMPGKTRGIWHTDQNIWEVPGFWPAEDRTFAAHPRSGTSARSAAIAAGEAWIHATGEPGTFAYIRIHPDRTFAAFEEAPITR